ncbi:Monothiol glutaredoxin-6 [Komagataella phaffii CBS 7435]|uniref:Cis-golgi localized monothiol glutaredoxin that binds an iron-sulfur cluster n=2 Tax=Komagataella phaffii TaxID=460519 RepID=C4R147_KOMPG|nr:Cis-golgi localized monothiol glutaredoxin that binds an iron-sulfur cluster [Komagataella phaffii GS115]AOA62861.1 GQ67_00640T0 [Komagataella phaffii]CAH2448253.1 Monothiol glutaredoxin-6 [Komagataella phaffii CBS 7435]AOA67824.1 GQ68_00748T0 [Komagataella phaffii GS115]CAY69221.1 Cis-golgi localized monothiol glutaredoxin that binds an iron-sulfur cluster [Komagataella phaffii GS115]CCA38388.1 Monothiol glutaredoxin-6 [Komagataella phaffii CBS 7435]
MAKLDKRTRILGLAALVLTIFLLITISHSDVSNVQIVDQTTSGKVKIQVETPEKIPPITPKVPADKSDIDHMVNQNDRVVNEKGEIDESKVKDAEESSSNPKQVAKSDGLTKETEPFDPAKEFAEIISMSPMVIFSKRGCPFSKKLKAMLQNNYEITPAPTIVELDLHTHGPELQQYIGEITGRSTVPNLLVNGISRGGCSEMQELHDANKLLSSLTQWAGKKLQISKVNAPSNH